MRCMMPRLRAGLQWGVVAIGLGLLAGGCGGCGSSAAIPLKVKLSKRLILALARPGRRSAEEDRLRRRPRPRQPSRGRRSARTAAGAAGIVTRAASRWWP